MSLSWGDALPVIEVPGVGEVPGEVVRQVAAAFGTRAVLALCDWQSGSLASETCDAYTPPAWLKRRVRARDGTCRFFGCTVPAARCDVDHVLAHPRGPTEEPNLMCLCRHHHRLKQQERWRVTMTEGAVVTWTTPVGDQFTTWPVDHLGVRDMAS
ncbi:HNH endonuclease [Pedococcus cremeus]|uniref:HNH endonuclease n=1 Tax=Pedococcus cremeus TaxID=587636 RepID=UPI000B80EDD9|nr:HNH endonuclease signature motif containing protein [Pedococcus cremeus]